MIIVALQYTSLIQNATIIIIKTLEFIIIHINHFHKSLIRGTG
jgi:hypothetical protein